MADEAVTEEATAEEPANPFADAPEDDTVELLGQDGEGAPEDAAQPSEVGDQPGKSKAPGQSTDPVEQLINEKYAGDRGKFVEGLHNQWNSSAQLAAELKEIKALLAAKETKSEEEIFSSDPDLVALNDQRALVEQELESIEETAKSIKADFAKSNELLIRERVLAEKSDDYDKEKHQAKVETLEARIANLNLRWGQLPHEQKRAQTQLKVIDNQISQAKNAVQSRSKAQKQQKESDEAQQATFRGELQTLIGRSIKENGLQEGGAAAKRMGAYIWMSIKEHLDTLKDEDPPIDSLLAVDHFSKEFMEGLKESQKLAFRTASTAKQNGGKPPAQQTQTKQPLAGAKRVSSKELTKEMIEAHHKRVFG